MITQIQNELQDLKQRNLLSQVARAAGLADRTIYRIASGETTDSRISTLTRIMIAIKTVKERKHK